MFIKKAAKILCVLIAFGMLTSCNVKNPIKTNEEINKPSSGKADSGAENVIEDLIYIAALDMPVGRKIKLVSEYDGNQTVTWSSSNPSVASVSQDGEIKAIKLGETIITATVGSTSDVCRVTVIDGEMTLAYLSDPGTLNSKGERVSPDKGRENYPVFIPESQDTLSKLFFKDSEYSWQVIADEKFNTNLTVPNVPGFTYIVKFHIILEAGRVGGSTITGEYKGKLDVKMEIDKESFIAAMKKQGADSIIDFNSNFIVQTADVKFTVTPYNEDEALKANNAFKSNKPAITPAPLVPNTAMAISTAKNSLSGNIEIRDDQGGGASSISGKNGDIPFVIEISESGMAKISFPRMLMMCDRNWIYGRVIRLRIVDLP